MLISGSNIFTQDIVGHAVIDWFFPVKSVQILLRAKITGKVFHTLRQPLRLSLHHAAKTVFSWIFRCLRRKSGLVPWPVVYPQGITFLQDWADSYCNISMSRFRIRVLHCFDGSFKIIWRLQTHAKKIKQEAQSKYTCLVLIQDLEASIRNAIRSHQQIVIILI